MALCPYSPECMEGRFSEGAHISSVLVSYDVR